MFTRSMVDRIQRKEDDFESESHYPGQDMRYSRVLLGIELREQNQTVDKKQGYV